MNWKPGLCLIGLVLLVLSGCTPAGPKALLQGERLLEQGKTSAAIAKFEKAVELIPDHAMAHLYLGLAHHKNEDAGKAIESYQQAISINRDLAEARFNLGCLYLENGNSEAAAREFETYTTARSDDPQGWSKLGDAYLNSQRPYEAQLSFQRSLQLDPTNPSAHTKLGLIALKDQKPRSAYNHFRDALQSHPGYAPAQLNIAVVAHQFINDLPLALQHYQTYARIKPSPPRIQEVRMAIQQIQEALTSVPEPSVGSTDPEPLEETQPDPGPAITEIESEEPDVPNPTETEDPEPQPEIVVVPEPVQPEEVIETVPTEEVKTSETVQTEEVAVDTPDTDNETTKQLDESDPVEAITVVDLAQGTEEAPLVFAPPDPETSQPQDGTYQGDTPRLQHWEGEAASAILKNEAFVRRHATAIPLPPQPGYRDYVYLDIGSLAPGDREFAMEAFNRGYEAQSKNELAEAIKAYEEAWQRDPSFFDAHYNLGYCSSLGGDLTRSMRAYERALALKPESVAARYNFAVMLKKAGYMRDAAIQLIRILEENPGETRVHFTLANIYAQQLRLNTEAMRHYRKVLELNPQHPQAGEIRKWIAARP